MQLVTYCYTRQDTLRRTLIKVTLSFISLSFYKTSLLQSSRHNNNTLAGNDPLLSLSSIASRESILVASSGRARNTAPLFKNCRPDNSTEENLDVFKHLFALPWAVATGYRAFFLTSHFFQNSFFSLSISLEDFLKTWKVLHLLVEKGNPLEVFGNGGGGK